MKLLIRKEAEREVSRVRAWYEQKRIGLGAHFVTEVEHGFRRILQHPELYAICYRGIRRAPLRTFPYSIYYLVADEQSIVLRVLHQQRQQPDG